MYPLVMVAPLSQHGTQLPLWVALLLEKKTNYKGGNKQEMRKRTEKWEREMTKPNEHGSPLFVVIRRCSFFALLESFVVVRRCSLIFVDEPQVIPWGGGGGASNAKAVISGRVPRKRGCGLSQAGGLTVHWWLPQLPSPVPLLLQHGAVRWQLLPGATPWQQQQQQVVALWQV